MARKTDVELMLHEIRTARGWRLMGSRGRYTKLTPEVLSWIREQREQGRPIADLAAELGVSQQAIRKARRRSLRAGFEVSR